MYKILGEPEVICIILSMGMVFIVRYKRYFLFYVLVMSEWDWFEASQHSK